MKHSKPLAGPLKVLHAELSAIEYEERPSFAPELAAELAGEWARLSEEGSRNRGVGWLTRHSRRFLTRPLIVLGAALMVVVVSVLIAPVRRAALSPLVSLGEAPAQASTEVNLAGHLMPRAVPDPPDASSAGWSGTGEPDSVSFLSTLRSVQDELTDREPLELLAPSLALADPSGSLGPVANVLSGTPPPRVATTPWRAAAGAILERLVADEPANAAPPLALARLRLKQGLREEAVFLLDLGMSRAVKHPQRASSRLVADLLYERGLLLRDRWNARVSLGVVRLSELNPARCPAAPAIADLPEDSLGVPVSALVAWNYLCPNEFARVISSGFEFTEPEAVRDGSLMLEIFRAAVEVDPRHVGANVHHLLPLTDQGRWHELLTGADRFVAASDGHPYGHLLAGLALRRLGRTSDAGTRFVEALKGLPESDAEAIRDVGFLLEGAQLAEYRRVRDVERASWEADFWRGLDPDPLTPVNEREVEHLARAAHVLLRFGDLGCDAAEVWIRYGRPSDIRVFGDPEGLITEFWDYRVGADATFVRPGPGIPPTLTAEGKAYLHDLREVLPHYGAVDGYQ